MKYPLYILLIQIFFASCSNRQPNEVKRSKNITIKSVTEYLDDKKIHYREFDSLNNELLHFYFKEDGKVEKEFYTFDLNSNLLTEKRFINDSLLEELIYDYEFDSKLRTTKITSTISNKTNSKFFVYIESNDTIIKTIYLSEQGFNENKWLSKIYYDKTGKWLRTRYNKIYGGGGEQIINHFNADGIMDYQIHFYLGFDTTFFQYNQKKQLLKTTKKEIDREEYGDYEYDKEGNKTKWIITKIIYYQNDTQRNVWTYDWKKL